MRIGLALGGGGARGLAHIAVLEAFDEAGVRPAMVAGTSIGALIGAVYASGMPAAEIRRYCETAFGRRGAILRHISSRWKGRVWDIWRPGAPALFKSERIFELALPPGLAKTFEELRIPFISVATGFFEQSAHVSSKGALLPAIAASAALPALLTPVSLDGRILIDGGYVNPLPFDLLKPRCDFTMAVDVSGGAIARRPNAPRAIEALLGAQQIALRSIVNAKLKIGGPDSLLRPDVGRFGALDFRRIHEILAASEAAKAEAAQTLAALPRAAGAAAG
ncbi:MAG: patatin-like phospholipase family protein [Rhodomicrobium sp.]